MTWHDLKFKGKYQKMTPCATILELQKLLLILGSKAAVEFRDCVLECFNRVLVFAGDHTLIREIRVWSLYLSLSLLLHPPTLCYFTV